MADDVTSETLYSNTGKWTILPAWRVELAERIAAQHRCEVARYGVELHVTGAKHKVEAVCAQYQDATAAIDAATERAAQQAGRPGRSWCTAYRLDAVKGWGVAPAVRRSRRASAAAQRSAERRAESDEAVRRELGDDWAALRVWETVKHRIRATERSTRTEVFQQYLHDHPEALDEARNGAMDEWANEDEDLESYEDRCGWAAVIDEIKLCG